MPHLRRSDRLLDVGAGPGTVTADLARLVGAGGRVRRRRGNLVDLVFRHSAGTLLVGKDVGRAGRGLGAGPPTVDGHHATRADLRRFSSGWRRWAEAEDGWFSVLHGEIVCRVPQA